MQHGIVSMMEQSNQSTIDRDGAAVALIKQPTHQNIHTTTSTVLLIYLSKMSSRPSSSASNSISVSSPSDSTNGAPPAAPGATTAQPRDREVWPPGVRAFLDCETGEATQGKGELAALATDLLLLVQQEKLCDIVKGGRSGDQWKKLHDDIFAEGGLFGGYKMWGSATPWSSKLKPLCQSIIKHFSNEHDKKGGVSTTALEDVAKTLSLRMSSAERDKEEDKDRNYARKVQNELVEADMGFRPIGNGVASPSGVPIDASYQAGLAMLGVQTGSVNEASGKILHSNCCPFMCFY